MQLLALLSSSGGSRLLVVAREEESKHPLTLPTLTCIRTREHMCNVCVCVLLVVSRRTRAVAGLL